MSNLLLRQRTLRRASFGVMRVAIWLNRLSNRVERVADCCYYGSRTPDRERQRLAFERFDRLGRPVNPKDVF